MLRAALYCRVFTLGQEQDGSWLDTEEAAGRVHRAHLGATVDPAHVYREVYSGVQLWERPVLTRLRAAIRQRQIDVVIVYAIDRLARDPVHLGVILEEATHAGVRVEFVSEPLDGSPEGELIRFVRGYAAKVEHAKIVERTQRGKRDKAARSQVVGIGRCPYGYEFVREFDEVRQRSRVVGLKLDPASAPIVQRIFRDAARFSLDVIATRLNAEGVPSPDGGGWRSITLRKIVRNSCYLGTMTYGRRDHQGREHDKALWILIPVPALVTPPEADAAEAAITARARRPRGRRLDALNTADPFFLRGLLTCGHCQGALAVSPRRGRAGAYGCLRGIPSRARLLGKPLCACPAFHARALEAIAWGAVTDALTNPATLATGLQTSRAQYDQAHALWTATRKGLDRQLGRHRKALKELVVSQATAKRGNPTWQALDQAIKEADTTITQLEREREAAQRRALPGLSPDQATALAAFADEVRAGIPAALPSERHEVLRLLGYAATVYVDPLGVTCGRYAVRIEWTSRVPLPGA